MVTYQRHMRRVAALVWLQFPPPPRTVLLVVFIHCLVAVFSHTAGAADPASRHQQLATAIATVLQDRSASQKPKIPYVHWVQLDQDAWVDAIVLLKRHEGSCAFGSTECEGYLFRGTRNGFTVLSSFSPNHHPLYLGLRSSGRPLRTLYHTGAGEKFNEIVFRDGRYQIHRRGLSMGQVRDFAQWSVTETQFDDLAEQTAVVARLGRQPLGAPIDVRIPQPPKALTDANVTSGYQVAKRLEGKLQEVFSSVAARHLLSHSVHVQLVACDDWITRVPLANQQDRSSRQVVGCLEPMGILADAGAKDAVQFQVLLYLLTGTFGQALAIQDNLLERLLQYIESNRRLPSEKRKELSLLVHRLPYQWFYLYGHDVGEPIGSPQLPVAVSSFLYAVHEVVKNEAGKRGPRNEHNVLGSDVGYRFQMALCAQKRAHNVKVVQLTGEVIQGSESLKVPLEDIGKLLSPPVTIGINLKKKEFVPLNECDFYGEILDGLSE